MFTFSIRHFAFNIFCIIMFLYFLIPAGVSLALALVIRRLALRLKIQDAPDDKRKFHKKSAPLLGGLAPFVSFFGCVFYLFWAGVIPQNFYFPFLGLFFGGAVIMFGGILDDKFSLSPSRQIIFPLIAIFIVLFFGIKIKLVTNPFGGIFYLGILPSLFVSFIWLLGISYTTKILDGLDGLVSGITVIGAGAIFLFTTLTDFKEGALSLTALVLAGSFAGFLILNFHPAKIFLGEGGSVFAGFILGGLAIMTGAKIAVTLMVLALPLIDLLAVMIKRRLAGRPIFSGDRRHLHFYLVDKGWGQRRVVAFFWILSAALGILSIFLPSAAKVAVLIFSLIFIFFADMSLK